MTMPWLNIVALLMALLIVIAGLNARRVPLRAQALMALAWIAIFTIAAAMFAHFHR